MSPAVVLITAEEEFLGEREVAQRVRQIRSQNPDLELREVLAEVDSAASDFLAACSPGLFGDEAVVLVDPITAADDALQAAIMSVVEDESNTTPVLLVNRGGVKGSGFVNKLRKAGLTEVKHEKLKGRAIDDFLAQEFKSHKRKVDPEAVATLRNAVGDDLRALAAAASQLSADIENSPITADDISVYFDGMAAVAPYEVSDAVLAGQVVKALTSLRWALERDPGMGPAIIATLANAVRGLVAVKLAPAGVPDAELARLAGVPPFKIRTFRDLSARWSQGALADAALKLTAADAALKGGQISELGVVVVLDPPQRMALLERTIVAIARSR